MEVLSDPLVVTGLLLGLAAVVLLFGLALQGRGKRRLPLQQRIAQEPPSADASGRSDEDLATAQKPVINGQPPEDPRWMEELGGWIGRIVDARMDEVEGKLDARINSVEDELDDQIEEVESAIDAGAEEVEAKIESAIQQRGDQRSAEEIDALIGKVEAKIEGVDAKATLALRPVMEYWLREDRRWMDAAGFDPESNGADPSNEAGRKLTRAEETVVRVRRELDRLPK